ncbi:MAG: T9SS type A sorting domain-containing protein [Bacteroidota bacterium]
MRKLLVFFFAATFVFLNVKKLSATHVMAGSITYKYLSADTLFVTLKVYRDCNGVTFSNSPFNIVGDKGGFSSTTLTFVSRRDVTGIGPNCGIQSRCTGTYSLGFEEHIYEGKIRIPSSTNSCIYTLKWEQCCRNSAITTGASNHNFYIETTFNKCLAAGNSSPEFIEKPVFILQLGQDHVLNHSAVDPDGDFLTYELVYPIEAPNDTISYISNWSLKSPLTYRDFPNHNATYPGGFRFDTLTANMSFRPTKQNEITVICVKVTEWRKINGTLTKIGEVLRDVQLIVVNTSSNNAPAIGIPNQSTFDICKPSSGCVTVRVEDPDTTDSLTINYVHNLKNATVTYTTISSTVVDVKVCFTVDTAAFINGSNYYFNLYAQDNACPLPAKSQKSYALKLGVTPIVFPQVRFCETQSTPVILSNLGTWSGAGISDSANIYRFTPSSAGKGWHQLKFVRVDSNSISCNYSDSIMVRVIQKPKADFTVNDTLGMPNDVFAFTNTTVADTVYSSVWFMGVAGDTNKPVTQNVTYTYKDTGEFTVKLVVGNAFCPNDSIVKPKLISIGAQYFPPNSAPEIGRLQPSSFGICKPDSGCFTIRVEDADTADSLAISFTHTLTNVSSTVTPISSNVTDVTLCFNIDSATFANNNSFTITLSATDNYYPTPAKTDKLYTFTKTTKSFAIQPVSKLFCETQSTPVSLLDSGSWSGNGVVNNGGIYEFTPAAAGKGWHTLVFDYKDSNSYGCAYKDSVAVRVLQTPKAAFIVNDTVGYPTDTFFFTNTTVADTAYQSIWNMGKTGLGSIITTQNAQYIYNDTGIYTVTLIVTNNICAADSIVKPTLIHIKPAVLPPSGVAEIAEKLLIYPSPASETVVIEVQSELKEVLLTDMTGKIHRFAANGNKAELNISELAAGAYIIKAIDAQGKQYIGKVLVQR